MALWDDDNARLTILDADGELVRTISLSSGAETPIQAAGVYGDGSILACREMRSRLRRDRTSGSMS